MDEDEISQAVKRAIHLSQSSSIGEGFEMETSTIADLPFNNDATQAERRRILAGERRLKTYMGHANDLELEMGGRYAKVTTTTVTGTTPVIQYPRQPGTSPANQAAMVPDEAPLGVDINAMKPTGEPFEVEASEKSSAAATDPAPASVRLRRRI